MMTGYCYLPYQYLVDDELSSELWTILKMEQGIDTQKKEPKKQSKKYFNVIKLVKH